MFPAEFTAFVVFHNVHAGKVSIAHPCLEIICLTKVLKAQSRLVNYSIWFEKYNKESHAWCKLASLFKTTDWEIS